MCCGNTKLKHQLKQEQRHQNRSRGWAEFRNARLVHTASFISLHCNEHPPTPPTIHFVKIETVTPRVHLFYHQCLQVFCKNEPLVRQSNSWAMKHTTADNYKFVYTPPQRIFSMPRNQQTRGFSVFKSRIWGFHVPKLHLDYQGVPW